MTRHAGVGEARADLGRSAASDGGELGDMADGDASAVSIASVSAADLIEVHPRRIEIEVEMQVDIEIESRASAKIRAIWAGGSVSV